jgi:preprotein translocase subunit SecF
MKLIRFSRAFLPCTIVSAVLILSGVFAAATRGINFGLDFAPGLIEEVRIAPTAFTVSYGGAARAVVETDAIGVSLIISGAGAENATYPFPFASYPTVGDLVNALNSVAGVKAAAVSRAAARSASVFVDSSISTVLTSSTLYRFHYTDSARPVSADDIRSALTNVEDISVKQIGADEENAFQIRIGTSEQPDSAQAGDEIAKDETESGQEVIARLLKAVFGNDEVAVIKTDFVAAQFSQSLVFKSILIVLATLVLIWGYSTFRFKWDFALGAVLAIVHDALIMAAFIAWTQMEFSITVLAAILTIIGYSINDTIVVLDRVREDMNKADSTAVKFTEILDRAQTEILSRTIITTITTMLAVAALFVFTTGSMKDFALALMVGMISGVYSTIYITGAFIALTRRNWKPQAGLQHRRGGQLHRVDQ